MNGLIYYCFIFTVLFCEKWPWMVGYIFFFSTFGNSQYYMSFCLSWNLYCGGKIEWTLILWKYWFSCDRLPPFLKLQKIVPVHGKSEEKLHCVCCQTSLCFLPCCPVCNDLNCPISLGNSGMIGSHIFSSCNCHQVDVKKATPKPDGIGGLRGGLGVFFALLPCV
jgi:hypothetical protein